MRIMKLLFTIIQDQDAADFLDALMENGFRATRLSSTGGFLRAGNTTLLIGVENSQADAVLNLVKKTCKRRGQVDPIPLISFARGKVDPHLENVIIGGANIFSVDVERFEKI